MHVILTIDVESYTGDYEREVFAGGKGLEFVLEACRRHGVRGTFFVEALGVTRWGYDATRRICSRLLEDGHDIQLHLHPVVARLDGFDDREDVLCHRDLQTQEMLLREALRALRECGAGSVTAFRAGDFAADERTLQAIEAVGLFVSANRDLDRKSSIRTRLNDHFPVSNDLSARGRIVDLPVTACRSRFVKLDGKYRHMEIAAMGYHETRDALCRLAAAGYRTAGILTHPPEFFRYAGDDPVRIEKNCTRLERLLAFVARREDMHWGTVAACATPQNCAPTQPPEVFLNPIYSLQRILQQARDRIRRKARGEQPYH